MISDITFKDVSARELGLFVETMPGVPVPARVYERAQVAGRSGSLTLDARRLDDVQIKVTFNVFASGRVDAARAWLTGRGKLILSDAPDRYYNAYVSAQSQVKRYRPGGHNYDSVSVTFTCEPYAYLIGTPDTPFTASGVLHNLGNAPAEPLIRVYGASDGTLTLGGRSLSFTAPDVYTDIDFGAKFAFKGDVSKNTTVSLSQPEWPVLGVGDTAVSFTGATSIVVTPRWRYL